MIRILPSSPNSLHIQWEDMEGDTFQVSRSTSPENGYEIIATDLTLPIYVDSPINLNDTGTRHYYKVEGFVGGVPVSEEKGVTLRYNPKSRIAHVAIHENQVVLRVMGNPPVKILLKRKDAKRCPNCWNPVTKRPRFAGCTVCNGTGTISGYHEPIQTLISREFSQLVEGSNMVDGEKVDQSTVNAWITNTPLVSPGDVVVDALNQRFSIDRVIQRTHSQYVIRQIIDMHPLEKGHPAYSTPVDWSDWL